MGNTPTSLVQSGETRPKRPLYPFMRFKSDRQRKIMSELHKEATKRWNELSEEAKRPYVENYETASDFWTKSSQMWNDLTPEEREAYHERARKINEKGQGDLLAATMKKMRSGTSGRPADASMRFRHKFLSHELKEAHKEMKREWS